MTSLREAELYLESVATRKFPSEQDDEVATLLQKIKAEAVSARDEDAAKLVWCYEQILDLQAHYLSAFKLLTEGSYYDAWCALERTELDLLGIDQHYSRQDLFRIEFIATQIKRFQSLFPYKLFISPEFLVTGEECSICHAQASIRNPCGHRVGEIYAGEQCARIVKVGELLGTAIVENPIQKYSVLSVADPKEHSHFPLLHYLIERLQSPFDMWRPEWSNRWLPHSQFKDTGRNDKCPCESGKKYKKCCLPVKEGVIRPHCEFVLANPSPGLTEVQVQALRPID